MGRAEVDGLAGSSQPHSCPWRADWASAQSGPLILFGLAGYLRFQARQKNYVAGAFLFFAALKPHLIFLVWVALLLYTLRHKRWESLAAFLSVLGFARLLAV